MPSGESVFDTTCVLYFALTRHDDLLEEQYVGRCYLPNEVVVEIERGKAEHGYNCSGLLKASWWQLLAITEPTDQALFFKLLNRWGKSDRNHGEAAALVLAKQLGCIAVVGDLQGRKVAKELGEQIIGTIGIS